MLLNSTINDLIPILLFTLSTSITPGPNNFMLMNSGLNYGIKKSLPHYFGICIGFPAMVLIVALGFGAVFLKYSWLKHILKIIGSAYMLYLAYKILTANNNPNFKQSLRPFSFIQAVLFQWINPKAWLMAIGAISIFSISNNYFHNALALSFIFFLACLPCIAAWLIFGASLQKILKTDTHRAWCNIILALCLVASIVMIFFE